MSEANFIACDICGLIERTPEQGYMPPRWFHLERRDTCPECSEASMLLLVTEALRKVDVATITGITVHKREHPRGPNTVPDFSVVIHND